MPNLILPCMDDMPSYDSDFFNGLANHLWDRFLYCRDSRRPLEMKWQQADEGYFAKRRLPQTGSIDWVIDGDMGETDLHDIVNLIAIRLTQAAMPRNREWLKVASRELEAQPLITAIQDQQMYLHELAETRRNMKRFIMQELIRGASPVYVSWHNRYRLRRAGRAETRMRAAKMFADAGMDPKEARKLNRGRVRELSWAGPRIETIDLYDTFIHPTADILNDIRPFTIIQRFRRLSELFAEEDEWDEKVYKNMGTPKDPEIVPFEASEIWNNRDFAHGRAATQEILGMNPTRLPSGEKVVPVYIFFIPYLEWEGEEFWDCYIHIARSKSGRGVRVIRYEENDSDMGWNRLIMDNYTDWITPGNFGISPVWMSLSKWDQLNLIEALTVQSAMAVIHPAYMTNESAFINPNEVSFAPGATIPIDPNVDPKLAIVPVPAPANGMNLGEQAGRLWSDKLRSQMNVDGLEATNPAKSSAGRRTATEINQDSTAGSIYLDNQADQLNGVLSKVCQIVYDDSRQNLRPDPWGYIEYNKYVQKRVQTMRLQFNDLDVERSITVKGFMGVMNETQELQNLARAIEVATPLMPMMAPAIGPYMEAAFVTLMSRLHVEPAPPTAPAPGMMPPQAPPQQGGMMPPQGGPPSQAPPMAGAPMPQAPPIGNPMPMIGGPPGGTPQ